MKKYIVSHTGVSTVFALSFVNLFAKWCLVTNVYGAVETAVSDGKFMFLVVIFNILTAFSGLIIGNVSDFTKNKKIGVWLGCALTGLSIVFPSYLGVTVKVVLSALGITFIDVFSLPKIIDENSGKVFGVGTYLGFGFFGFGLGKYFILYGYLAAAFMCICAAIPTVDNTTDKKKEYKPFYVLFTAILLLSSAILFNSLENIGAFGWFVLKKSILICSFFMLFGALCSDFIRRIAGSTVSVLVSAVGTVILFLLKKDTITQLAFMFFIAMLVSEITAVILKSSKHVGFAVSTLPAVCYLFHEIVTVKEISASLQFILISAGIIILSILIPEILAFIKSKKKGEDV